MRSHPRHRDTESATAARQRSRDGTRPATPFTCTRSSKHDTRLAGQASVTSASPTVERLIPRRASAGTHPTLSTVRYTQSRAAVVHAGGDAERLTIYGLH